MKLEIVARVDDPRCLHRTLAMKLETVGENPTFIEAPRPLAACWVHWAIRKALGPERMDRWWR